MKKLCIALCMLCLSVAVKAQFEEGKWIVIPSVTGLNLSYSSSEGTSFGINGEVGAFLVDNTALVVGVGGNWGKYIDTYTASVGGRYYIQANGIYLGAGLSVKHWSAIGSLTDYGAYGEVGYAYFITKTITIEPAVIYNLSFKDGDYSKIGLKVGFGIYF